MISSAAPNRSSRRVISLLIAEGVSDKVRPAEEKLPSSTTRTKTIISLKRSMAHL